MLYYIYYNIYYNIYNIKLVAPYLPPKLIFQNVACSAVAHVALVVFGALVLWCAVIIIFPGKKRVAKFLDARHEYKTR